ncbi:MAG: type III pantothenate kinase [Oscillospiraceae bacterium]|nr:type III pantothenate kinase [Oscillospiraceae bacterium]
MILAIDIGNTNIVMGGLVDGKQVFSSRFASDRNKTEDEYALMIQGILSMHHVDPSEIEGGILSSVVPYLRTVVPRAVYLLTGKQLLVVGSGLKTGLNIRMDNPASVGSDLIVDAVAALAKFPPPLVIFDMGTATTMSVIDARGDYVGGMIIPGLRVSMDALSARAAQLPYINFAAPDKLIGTNTVDCMQSGAVYGCAAMMDGLIDRVEDELGQKVTCVLTGGLGKVVGPHCRREIHIIPDLLIDGLKVLYEKNQPKRKK